MKKDELRILQVGNVLVSPDIITEKFCCDLDACKGECCIEGDAGAPVTLDEIMEIEDALDVVWDDLSASAQAIIDKQGVAYTDIEGDLVTSIVNGKDCVFTCYQDLKDLGGWTYHSELLSLCLGACLSRRQVEVQEAYLLCLVSDPCQGFRQRSVWHQL